MDEQMDVCINCDLQMNESLDVEDAAQIAVMIRMVFKDYTAKEEFLAVIPLKNRKRDNEVHEIDNTRLYYFMLSFTIFGCGLYKFCSTDA